MFELPFRRLRKGAVAFALLLSLFILYRLFLFETSENEVLFPETETPEARTEMCLLVSKGGPVNIDTVFNTQHISGKIYAYSFLDTGFNVADTIWHVWHRGSEAVKTVACDISELSCVSFLSVDSLAAGDWSLDTRQNEILLNVRQFKVDM